MSRKVDTRALRTGITKPWLSSWFAEGVRYGTSLVEDDKIRKYLSKKLRTTGLDQILIDRSIQKITITIRVSKPGIVIGRKGAGLAQLRIDLAKITKADIDLQVEEVKKPELSAAIVAESLAMQIERRVHAKRALSMATKKSIDAGAKGIKVEISGTVNGPNSVALSDGATVGKVPTQTLRADIDYAKATAFTRGGTIGVKVWIYRGEMSN
jgi:small subunit ribosomal protein S3